MGILYDSLSNVCNVPFETFLLHSGTSQGAANRKFTCKNNDRPQSTLYRMFHMNEYHKTRAEQNNRKHAANYKKSINQSFSTTFCTVYILQFYIGTWYVLLLASFAFHSRLQFAMQEKIQSHIESGRPLTLMQPFSGN